MFSAVSVHILQIVRNKAYSRGIVTIFQSILYFWRFLDIAPNSISAPRILLYRAAKLYNGNWPNQENMRRWIFFIIPNLVYGFFAWRARSTSIISVFDVIRFTVQSVGKCPYNSQTRLFASSLWILNIAQMLRSSDSGSQTYW
jgi:hypothetical protein